MKKIEKRVAYVIISLGILIILFFLVLILRQYLASKESFFIYNGFEVQKIRDKSGQFYNIKIFINENNIPSYVNTRYGPKELEKIPTSFSKDSILKKSQIFITIDPYANLSSKTTIAALEIDKFIDNEYLYNISTKSAFTKPYKNQTVKTCNDVTSYTGIILLTLGKETKIYEDKCIIVQGKAEEDLIRAADRLALTLLEVMHP